MLGMRAKFDHSEDVLRLLDGVLNGEMLNWSTGWFLSMADGVVY